MKDRAHPPRAFTGKAPETITRAPRAFALEADASPPRGVVIEESREADPFAPKPPAVRPAPPSRLLSWGRVVWGAFWLLATLYIADASWRFVVDLETRSPVLGQIALGLITILVLGLVVFLAREALALFRMRRIASFRVEQAALGERPDQAAMRRLVMRLSEFYAADPTSAAGRSEVARVLGEIHDPATVMAATERALLGPKDLAARQMIADAAQRVSVVTALSPRALVDVVFVLVQSLSLIRRLSALYGGRASGLGLWRLGRRVATHLALTGGMAVADSLVGQFLGAGLAARLSAKLGEGVLNGILTARVGIAAIDLCRPLEFQYCEPILLSEVVKNTITQGKIAENPAA